MFSKESLMRLHITPARLISEVQKDFNTEFPFLKIEFFRNKVYQQPDYSLQQILPKNRKIGDGQSAAADGDIEINASMKVKDVEKIFKDQFSLIAQIFRRTGNLWLQTTMTDNWTLGQQNEHGREISTDSPDKPAQQANDYDLNRDAGS